MIKDINDFGICYDPVEDTLHVGGVKISKPENNMETPTETTFNAIMQSELFRLNGQKIDLCEALQTLCRAIKNEDETNWSLGEFGECTLDSLLIGAYWALSEWHAGQSSPEYAALCSIGGIFSPGHTSAPTSDEESEYWPYVAVNNYFADKSGSPEQRIEC